MREAPLAHNTCQSACNIQGSWKGCKSVTGKCNLLNHQLLQGANEQGGKRTRGQQWAAPVCLLLEGWKSNTWGCICAAGAYHAKKTKLDRKHVEDLTAKLQRKAAGLGETDLLSRLSGGQDVGALEVFYHGNCLKAFNYKHERYTASVSNIVTTEIQDNSVLLTSSLNLRKVTAFMVDSAAVEPGTMFKVQDF